MSNDILLNIKKRNRPSLVCLVCKKRKIKCDKGKPCSSCVKNQMVHLCRYNEPVTPSGFRKLYRSSSEHDVSGIQRSSSYSALHHDGSVLSQTSTPEYSEAKVTPGDQHVYVTKQYLDDLNSHMETLQAMLQLQQNLHNQLPLQPPQIRQPQPQPQTQPMPMSHPIQQQGLPLQHQLQHQQGTPDGAYQPNLQMSTPVPYSQPSLSASPQQPVVPPHLHPHIPIQLAVPPYLQSQSIPSHAPPPPPPQAFAISSNHQIPQQMPFNPNLAPTPIHITPQYPPPLGSQYPPHSLPGIHGQTQQFAILPSQLPPSVSPSYNLHPSKLQMNAAYLDLRSQSLPNVEPMNRPIPQTPNTLGNAPSETSDTSRSTNVRLHSYAASAYNSSNTYNPPIMEEEQIVRDYCAENEIDLSLFNVQVHPFFEMDPPSQESKGVSYMHRYKRELESMSLKSATIMDLNKSRQLSGTIGMNPFTSSEETINFHKGFNPIIIEASGRRSCAGPLSWSNLKRKDCALRLISKRLPHSSSIFAENKLIANLPTDNNHVYVSANASIEHKGEAFQLEESKQSGSSECPKPVDTKANVPYEKSHIQGLSTTADNSNEKQSGNISKVKSNIGPSSNTRVLTLDLTLNMTHIGKESKWTAIIQKVIPKRRTIWTLLDLFFGRVYAYFPYVDEILFKSKICSIIGPAAFVDETPKIKIEKRVDLAYIGTLFCILRLTYLYVVPYDDQRAQKILESVSNDDVNKYVLENPIPITLIDVTAACIEHFIFVRKLCLPVFQCCWYYRLYQIHAPEDGENCDPATAQLAHSILVSTAYAIGLNREPSLIAEYAISQNEINELTDERTKSLSRKLWYALYFVDHMQTFSEGCYPIRITSSDYDVQLPRLSAEASNSTNLELEKQVMQVYAFWDICADGPIAKILQLVLPMNRDVKVEEVMKLLSHSEVNVLNVMGSFDNFLQVLPEGHPDGVVRVGTLGLLMFSYSVFLSLYLLFLIHYNERGNYVLEYFYLQKLFYNNIMDCFPYFLKLVYGVDDIYGRGAGMMLLPEIITMIVRTIESLFLVITRANMLLFSRSSIPEKKYELHHNEKLEMARKILKYSEKVARILLFALTKLMTKYYIAWKNYKSLLFILDMITKESYYAEKDPLMEQFVTPTPFYEALKICEICDKSFEKFIKVSETIEDLDLNDLLEKITRSSDRQKDATYIWGTSATNLNYTKESSAEIGQRKEEFALGIEGTNSGKGVNMDYSDQRPLFASSWNRNFTDRPPMQSLKLTQSDISVYGRQPPIVITESVGVNESISRSINNDTHPDTPNYSSIPVVASDYQNIPIDNGEAIDSRWLQMDTYRKTKTNHFDSLGPFSDIGGPYSGLDMPFLSDMHTDDFIDQMYTNRYMLVDVENLGGQADGLPFTNGITSELNAELFTDMA